MPINSNHIGAEKQKNKVKLAAQTFSALVTDSLEFSELDLKIQNVKVAHLLLNMQIILTDFLIFRIQAMNLQGALKHQ